MSVPTLRGWIVVGGVIFQSILRVNWDTMDALTISVASGKQYEQKVVHKNQWCVLLDLARQIATKQVELIYNNHLKTDPVEAATWEPYLLECKMDQHIIYRFVP